MVVPCEWVGGVAPCPEGSTILTGSDRKSNWLRESARARNTRFVDSEVLAGWRGRPLMYSSERSLASVRPAGLLIKHPSR